jgi:hypothetical protein
MGQYTTFDISKKLGINRGRLREWMNDGYTPPSIQVAEGQGTKALFDDIDILAMLTFKTFIEDHKIFRSEAGQMVKEWANVMHTFRDTAGDGAVKDFIEDYDLLKVIRKDNKSIVGHIITTDIITKYFASVDPEKIIAKRFVEALGRPFFEEAKLIGLHLQILNSADMIAGLRTKRGNKIPFFDEYVSFEQIMDFDSLFMINFKKIKKEAAKILA